MSLSIDYGKTIPVTESGCLIWLGATTPSGYGKVGTNRGEFAYVHRLSFQERYGPIPAGMMVCHKCDTPSCLEPTHLFLGTATMNVRDMVRKGRHKSNGVLSKAQVSEIQALVGVPCNEIASAYGITAKHASAVRSGLTFRRKRNV